MVSRYQLLIGLQGLGNEGFFFCSTRYKHSSMLLTWAGCWWRRCRGRCSSARRRFCGPGAIAGRGSAGGKRGALGPRGWYTAARGSTGRSACCWWTPRRLGGGVVVEKWWIKWQPITWNVRHWMRWSYLPRRPVRTSTWHIYTLWLPVSSSYCHQSAHSLREG